MVSWAHSHAPTAGILELESRGDLLGQTSPSPTCEPQCGSPELIELILAHRRERGGEEAMTSSLGARAPPQASLL